MKKKWTITLAILISLGLAACGSDETDITTAEESGDSSANVDVEETAVEETVVESEIPEEAKFAELFKEQINILTDEKLELSQESYDYIVANHTLFPTNTDEAIAQAKEKTDSSISIKHLNKNAQPYFQTLTTFQGTVVSVEEVPLDNGVTLSVTHILDDNMDSYQVFLYKTTGDILEDDVVRFWGVPVGSSSFENVSGGTTNVQNFFGSHIEKIN